MNRQVFGGWQISGITTIQSGTPFTVFNSSQDFSGFNQFNDRPDVVGSGALPQNYSNPDAAFNYAYFGCSLNASDKLVCPSPPTGRVGTSGRNQYYGPGLQNWNFAVSKLFPLHTERVHLRFRADFFNLYSHTNFANPIASESNGNFGKITATVGSATATAVGTTAGVVGGGPRVIQGPCAWSSDSVSSGQIKKGVRSIGFGGDGATWGNYALVWRDADTALVDYGLPRRRLSVSASRSGEFISITLSH